jgi:NADH:ubiquinone reductase (H+-translocating)
MWGFIHVLYLIGWGNRLGTLYTWLRALVFTKNRGHRIITFEQAHEQTLDQHPHLPASGAHPAPAPPPTAGATPPATPAAQATQRAG